MTIKLSDKASAQLSNIMLLTWQAECKLRGSADDQCL